MRCMCHFKSCSTIWTSNCHHSALTKRSYSEKSPWGAINRLCQACFEIAWYPSKEIYCTAVEQLIQKYPHLRDIVKKGSGMLLMEFNILFKWTIVVNIEHGCSRLCSIILDHGKQDEVVRFSAMASEDGVLGVLNFIAGRCNESLDVILTETAAVPLTPCLQRASDGSLALHIDAQRLFVTSSLLAGLACLFASFWVFHVVYP